MDAAQSGHPGGSSSKAEQVLTLLLSGALQFDAVNPKHPGRDRMVWSAGHCSPLFHAVVSMVYDALRQKGVPVTGDCVIRIPRTWRASAGGVVRAGMWNRTRRWRTLRPASSGHGFSAGLGFAMLHRSCGLDTKAWVIAGDAETEEGMSYEARNLAAALGARNLIVTLDYNNFGIDGPITEALPSAYLNHWFAQGWNIIEVDGHNIRELAYAYRLAAQGFGPERPTVVICHTVKGLHYGRLEGSADSHGTPLKHEEYVEAMRALGFGPGIPAMGAAERDYLTGAAGRDRAADSGGAGAGGPHAAGARGSSAARFPQLRAAGRAPARTGVYGRRIGPDAQGDGGVVRVGHAEHRVLLYRRGRPDEVDSHRQGREGVRRDDARESRSGGASGSASPSRIWR